LITALGNIRGLEVASRTSAFAMSEAELDVQYIGDALNVKYALESSVARDGDRIRISTQLIDAQTGFHIWAEEYDRDFINIFDLLDDVTSDLSQALRVQLFQKEPTLRLANTGTESAAAFNYRMLGKEALRLGMPGSFDQAIAYYDQAIELDPEYFGAWFDKAASFQSLPISRKEAFAAGLAIIEDAQRHFPKGTRNWDRVNRVRGVFNLEHVKRTYFHAEGYEVDSREKLVNGLGLSNYGHSLSHAGLFHTGRAYMMEKRLASPGVGIRSMWARNMAAGSGTQQETLELLSSLIETGDVGSLLEKTTLLYKMGRVVDAEELVPEIDARIAKDWPESVASLYRAAYLAEPLSEIMLEFIGNNQQLQLPAGTLLISAGYIDEGLERLERRVVDVSKLPFMGIRELTSAMWREDVKQEMMANQRFLKILDSIGVGEEWKQEHARRAMSLTAITGIEVDPRDLY